MKLTPVKSSNLTAMAHDPLTKNLRVKFSSGKQYDYPGVDAEAFQKLQSAESVGSHFAKHIRPKHTGKEVKP